MTTDPIPFAGLSTRTRSLFSSLLAGSLDNNLVTSLLVPGLLAGSLAGLAL